MKKAYIAGPVNGLDQDTVQKAFYQKEKELRAQGYEVVNPLVRIRQVNNLRIACEEHALIDSDPYDRKTILGLCLYDLSLCDEIHVLPGWGKSKGVALELAFAYQTGMKVVFQLEKPTS